LIFQLLDIRGYKKVTKTINDNGFALSDMKQFWCIYVGGHPERDKESSGTIFFGIKNGKLIFFEGVGLEFSEGVGIKYRLGCASPNHKFTHLLDIPISSILDIRYFDSTTSSTIAGVGTSIGGIGVGIPIRMKQGDASVLIDWNDGRFTHSTEFRFVGFFKGRQANQRANTLRNTLIKMTR